MSTDSINAPVIYKPIPGFPMYRVGDDGSVWSCHSGEWKPRVLTWNGSGQGYLTVLLRKDGKNFNRSVHVLVLLAHVGTRPDGHEGAHIDGKRENCRLSNLAWKTRAGNEDDKRRHGTAYRAQGEKHHGAKLTDEKVRQIRSRVAAGEPRKAVAESLGVTYANVTYIVLGKTWSHVK